MKIIKSILYGLVTIMVVGVIMDLLDDETEKQSIYKVKVVTNRPNATSLKKNVDMDLVEEMMKKDCVEYIQCLSAKEVAEEYGRTEDWVSANYKINIWEKTTENGKGGMVGEIKFGSRALIIDREGEDYKVLSPINNLIGWVNGIHISKTLYQDPKTLEKCKG